MRFLLTLFLLFISYMILAQPARNYAVELRTSWQQSPDQVTLQWRPVANVLNHLVYRKKMEDNSWGGPIASVDPTDSIYTDTSATYGDGYEYRVVRYVSGYTGYGYIFTQAEGPAKDYFGRLVLVIDTTHLAQLEEKLHRWIDDLNGDGWIVHPLYVAPGDSVTTVKTRIEQVYNQYPNEVEAVQLFGHAPVPYSGNLAPDGHTNNHQGAWPADGFYGDMNGAWSDVSVNNTTASGTRNDNVPGDGKYDQSTFPGQIELMVGRVDFANLPAFVKSEAELLEAYLDKDHAYRTGQIPTLKRAVIDDNFGGFSGEAFAASAWRSISTIIGSDSIMAGDYRTELNNGPYQWSYGCGGGSFTSAGGIGTTSQLAGDSLQAIFTMLFGSYFGDWDSDNNFLRAAVASGTTLCNAWSGRPHWYFHHMAMGYPIGYDTRVTMNNTSALYWPSYGARFVHIGLIGDVTLRQHTLEPPMNLQVAIVDSGGRTALTWTGTASAEGYYIYRKQDAWTPYQQVGVSHGTQWIDSCLPDTGTFFYVVRAFAEAISPSGSYRNLSPSSFDTFQNNTVIQVQAKFDYQISDFEVQFTNQSKNATSYYWDFGDGGSSTDANPVYDFGAPDTYEVMLTASGPCGISHDTVMIVIEPNGIGLSETPQVRVYPNPATHSFIIELDESTPLIIFNKLGQLVYRGIESITIHTVNTQNWPSGLYFIRARKFSTTAYPILINH